MKESFMIEELEQVAYGDNDAPIDGLVWLVQALRIIRVIVIILT